MENQSSFNNSLFGSKSEKVIETNELQIRGHLLRWKDVVIQISNISQIAIGNYPAKPFPLWSIAVILVGILILRVNLLIGLLTAFFGSIFIMEWVTQRQATKDCKYLHLYLNSGTCFSFLFQNESFLRKVLEVFANIFEDGEKASNSNVTIDIKNCTVNDNASFVQTLNSGV